MKDDDLKYKGVSTLGKENPDGIDLWTVTMENILDGSSPVGSGDDIFYLADMITDPPVPPIKGSLDETAMSALMKEFRNKKAADAKVKTLILQHCTATCKTNLTELEVQTSASYWKYLTTRFGHGTSAGHGFTCIDNLMEAKQEPGEKVGDFIDRIETLGNKCHAAGVPQSEATLVVGILKKADRRFQETTRLLLGCPVAEVSMSSVRKRLTQVEASLPPIVETYGLVTRSEEKDDGMATKLAKLQATVEFLMLSQGGNQTQGGKPCPLPNHGGHTITECYFKGSIDAYNSRRRGAQAFDNKTSNIIHHSTRYFNSSLKSLENQSVMQPKFFKYDCIRNSPEKKRPVKTAHRPFKDDSNRRVRFTKSAIARDNACGDLPINEKNEGLNNRNLTSYESEFCFSTVPDTTSGIPRANRSGEWYADSAATQHMSWQGKAFDHLEMTSNRHVKLGDGSTIPVVGVGRMTVRTSKNTTMILTEVLYIPSLFCNLLSVKRVQTEASTVIFPGDKPRHVFVKDKRGNVTLRGRLNEKGLYLMDMNARNLWKVDHAMPTIDVLHQRLNHIDKARIRKFQRRKQMTGLKISKSEDCPNSHSSNPCVGCAFGKMKRRRGKKVRENPATEPYERVHTDINTPSTRATGVKGYKKIITFTDEWSRNTKVYFIKSEKESLACFKLYVEWVLVQKKARIRELQADGGGVYIEGAFQSYLQTQGIKFKKTNRDEPSQNGIAERVGGTIVAAGLSMLKHAFHLSDSDWPYAIECAEDVYNMLPKEGLNGRSPAEVDSGNKSNLSSLRTFGCDTPYRH